VFPIQSSAFLYTLSHRDLFILGSKEFWKKEGKAKFLGSKRAHIAAQLAPHMNPIDEKWV
jgi:hypothetical protein